MSTREARARAPHAAYLSGRHAVYRTTSELVMARLRELSPLVEPLSLDEAFVDLAAGGLPDTPGRDLVEFAEDLKSDVARLTGGITGSVGIGPPSSWPRSPATSTSPTVWSSYRPGRRR